MGARGIASSLRCRRFARRAGLRVTATYLQLPSARAPAFVVEAAPASLDYLMQSVATVPPGTFAPASVVELALRALRVVCRTRLFSVLAPDRVVIGVRT